MIVEGAKSPPELCREKIDNFRVVVNEATTPVKIDLSFLSYLPRPQSRLFLH
jgi:hypothetical protein